MNYLAYTDLSDRREDAGKPQSEPEVMSQGTTPLLPACRFRSADLHDLHPVASLPLPPKSVAGEEGGCSSVVSVSAIDY